MMTPGEHPAARFPTIARIVATIGPASESPEMVARLISLGVPVYVTGAVVSTEAPSGPAPAKGASPGVRQRSGARVGRHTRATKPACPSK